MEMNFFVMLWDEFTADASFFVSEFLSVEAAKIKFGVANKNIRGNIIFFIFNSMFIRLRVQQVKKKAIVPKINLNDVYKQLILREKLN
ncbi:MAG: hypothetical protein QM652_07465 [Legionella sp.]|uniref:hypothetical protein n=1 Tax=Legionella sp. TaxID=459 RepID=UPI0039E59F6C